MMVTCSQCGVPIARKTPRRIPGPKCPQCRGLPRHMPFRRETKAQKAARFLRLTRPQLSQTASLLGERL